MKLTDLDKVRGIARSLETVQESYRDRFNCRETKVFIALTHGTGSGLDQVVGQYLDLDQSLEGPIAALVGQAYRKKISELEQQLRELGVDLNAGEKGAVL